MTHELNSKPGFSFARYLLVVAASALLTVGCKTSVSQSGGAGAPPPMPSPSGGMPSPSGGGMPSPSGGGMPSPSGGGTPSPPGGSSGDSNGDGSERGDSDGDSGGDSGGSAGGDAGGFPMPGETGGDGSSGTTGSDGSGDGGGGDVGSIPPPPSQRGAGGPGGDSGDGGEGGDGEENPFADADADGQGECGDSGVLPGGVGGMGQAGECIGGGGGAASESEASDSEAASAAGGGGGGGGAASGGSPGQVGQFPEESAEERAERLGRELDESIGGFDETLHEEQQEIAATGRVLEGFDVGGGGGSSADGDESGELISLGTQRRAGPQASNEGGQVGGKEESTPEIAGMTQQEIQERTPEDIPPAVDDDIIARQLREAALTEDDPVLRERLWNEYRKYRGLLTTE